VTNSKTSRDGKSNLTVPSPSGVDIVHAIVKAGLSAVPGAGGPLAEMMQLFLGPAIERRREDWMRRVAAMLTTLMANGLRADALQNDDRFISAVLQTTLIAQRTHNQEKLDALSSALSNIVTTQTPDEALESMFLGYIDSFTEWHIRILRVYEAPDPLSRFTEIGQVVERAYPELKGRPEIYETVWQDLLQKGLVDMQSLDGPINNVNSVSNRHATPLGGKFLRFIAGPIEGSV